MEIFHLHSSGELRLGPETCTGACECGRISLRPAAAVAWQCYVQSSDDLMRQSSNLRRRHHTNETGLSADATDLLETYGMLKTFTADSAALQPPLQRRQAGIHVSASTATTILIAQAAGLVEKMRLAFELHRRYPEIVTLKYFMAAAIDTARAGGYGCDGWFPLRPGLFVATFMGRFSMSHRHYRESREVALMLLRDVLAHFNPESMVHEAATALDLRIRAELKMSAGEDPESKITFSNRVKAGCDGVTPHGKHCINCGKPTRLKCSKCNTRYCSPRCQQEDRPIHKASCGAPASSAPPSGVLALAFDRCVYCGKAGQMETCAGCLAVKYCDTKCQKAHWKAHKPHCSC